MLFSPSLPSHQREGWFQNTTNSGPYPVGSCLLLVVRVWIRNKWISSYLIVLLLGAVTTIASIFLCAYSLQRQQQSVSCKYGRPYNDLSWVSISTTTTHHDDVDLKVVCFFVDTVVRILL